MKSFWTLATCHLLITATVNAQGVITRIGSDGTHFYYNGQLDSAVAHANLTTTTDTILLGGGTYSVPTTDLIIEQPIILVGTGPDIDSTAAYGGRTVIDGNDIFLRDGADSSEFHGLTITSNVFIGEFELNTTDVDHLLFRRCDLQSLRLNALMSPGATMANDVTLDNCVVRTNNLNLNGAANVILTNSVLKEFNSAANGTLVEHCLFLNWNLGNGPAGVTFRNNIFANDLCCSASVNGASTYINNLFVGNGDDFIVNYGMAVSHDDIDPVGTSLGSVFVNVSSYNQFTYAGDADYHLLSDWQGLGDDGTDPGPHGGNGWKEGGLPFSPHWRYLNMPASTVNGVLPNVHIKAGAQEN
ncbi:MAG TPA: hypothetical protein PKE53_09035 [Flavobacteriales bacterium]|nr:hypothetical protein [Flavobacteriales bacterium]MCC6542684.1 hypothetical protein [Flavobacteriales bacterium]HMU14136.1 hypothetical protein [Flavobacteriales bacterium]HMW96735.1 hypothetical protein [Flavobacteriales bacterium]HNM70181.1 hypothetical protein [Flavobacteriales bacterium]